MLNIRNLENNDKMFLPGPREKLSWLL
uniref:Uncharacterized protein n=1 Tax=Anguilla anguilla TaxID=7936 RepID=A0A0E9UN32_ANGAN